MTIYLVKTNNGASVRENRFPERLNDGRYQINHVGGMGWEVKVPFKVKGDAVTVFVSQIQGELSRVIFQLNPKQERYYLAPSIRLNAKKLKELSVQDITLSFNEENRRAFYIEDGQAQSVERWPDDESARLGYIPHVRGERGW